MNAEPATPDALLGSDACDHVSEARQRARQILGGEAHLAPVDDWRRAFVSARDTLILLWITWIALEGFGSPACTPWLLVTLAAARAVLVGMSTARSTVTQIQYYTEELEREQTEIREEPQHEREEVRALYAAKGFREPLLTQVVDTLVADDDRLLKLMMEEELGLSLQHINHPLLVAVWNGGPALLAGLALALPLAWVPAGLEAVWVHGGGAMLLALLSCIAAATARRKIGEFFTVSLVMVIVAGGIVHFLAQWLNRFTVTPTSS